MEKTSLSALLIPGSEYYRDVACRMEHGIQNPDQHTLDSTCGDKGRRVRTAEIRGEEAGIGAVLRDVGVQRRHDAQE